MEGGKPLLGWGEQDCRRVPGLAREENEISAVGWGGGEED